MNKPVRRGRPPKPKVDPATLDVLTIPEALVYARAKGRPMTRGTIVRAVVADRLSAYTDELRHDRCMRPLLIFRRVDFEAWLDATLQPFRTKPHGAAERVS